MSDMTPEEEAINNANDRAFLIAELLMDERYDESQLLTAMLTEAELSNLRHAAFAALVAALREFAEVDEARRWLRSRRDISEE